MSGPGGLLPSLSPEERRILLDLARLSVSARIEGRSPPGVPEDRPRLLARQGAFVTLRLRGDLRGCIGLMGASEPLAEVVIRCGAAAATEDPRFPPLLLVEFREVRIEISALGPTFRVSDLAEVELGRHGLLVSRGGRRGVLLPQVAVEQGWDRETFAQEACLKAGLPPDAWTRGALLEAFGAEVFEEEDPPGPG